MSYVVYRMKPKGYRRPRYLAGIWKRTAGMVYLHGQRDRRTGELLALAKWVMR